MQGPIRAQDSMEAAQLVKQLEAAKELLSEKAEAKADARSSQAQKGAPKTKYKKLRKAFKSLMNRQTQKTEKTEKVDPKDKLSPAAGKKAIARKYEGQNRELKEEFLMELGDALEKEKPEDPVAFIQNFTPKTDSGAAYLGEDGKPVITPFKDPSNVDWAFEYLIDTSAGDTKEKLTLAKKEFYEENKQPVIAGRHATAAAQATADQMVVTEDKLRDDYRDLVFEQPEAMKLFEEISDEYSNYGDMVKYISFLLKAAGDDLRSGGPSIEPGQLDATIKSVRKLQSILVIYRFFRGRMNYIKKRFENESLSYPASLSFESLAKEFIKVASDRFPSEDKVRHGMQKLSVGDDPRKGIIIGENMRDATPQVPKSLVFTTQKNYDEFSEAMTGFLEEMYEIVAEEEEELGNILDEVENIPETEVKEDAA